MPQEVEFETSVQRGSYGLHGEKSPQCRGEEGRVYRILPGSSESCRVGISPQVWDADAVSLGL